MGSSASKASRAAGSAGRKYPTQASPAATNAMPQPQAPPPSHPHPGTTLRPQLRASGARDQAINLDAADPDFAQSLRSIGPVQPNPTLSPTSAFNPSRGGSRSAALDPRLNPAIAVLDARARLQDQAEREFNEAGRRGHQGRQFLDVHTVRQILILRDGHKQKAADIEKRLGLMQGAVDRLGAAGLVELAHETGRAENEVRIV